MAIIVALIVADGEDFAYGVVTWSSEDSAVTAGPGYAYGRSSGDMHGAAVGMIGGEHRVSRRVKPVTETGVFSGGGIGSSGASDRDAAAT